MTKQRMVYCDDERLAKMDHAEELYLDMNEGMQNAEGDVPERVEYLRNNLMHALGRLTSKMPNEDWPVEQTEKLIDLVKWCHAYRNELRIFIHEYKGHDCSDARMSMRMVTDEAFGAPEGVVH